MANMDKLHGDVARLKKRVDQNLDSKAVRERLDISHFGPNAILRGVQLTLVGAHRALQNPAMFTSDHYRQAALAVVMGVFIRLIVAVPITGIRVLLWVVSMFFPLDTVSWDDSLIDGLNFIGEYVLQLPLFLMALMRYVVPTLDSLFMQSLHWVDKTYVQKHSNDSQDDLRDMYYPNLAQYSRVVDDSTGPESAAHALSAFLYRFARKGCISTAIFALSYLPVVGKLVLPVASFYTFNKAAGLGLAGIIFGTGIFLPRRCLVVFLQTYFASRSLTRELLEPYFVRVRFTKTEKRNWFRSREGVLFGFGLGFYALMKVPLLGVLIYGIAEASTAYLITKITDPPPPPAERREYAASQQTWRNRHEFLSLSLANLDNTRSNAPTPNTG
ncbi:etoposide-induced protein 2.4 (EI24) domain-containing protein [Hirsutella rhossiliensis]|uniref:Etoposide-induced protein 2.4 (EI24) domain-containing protein n=1 Tax=Hirsutella rhossiliensis TaxID=111463 RepID=A0A9P8MTE6_9HYPO|nr:etoposide-induced protein 2.4 (EI24) domain-containing protein [Hirsutella rhossiliensis]KAH0960074.1 etoposide-induced protein 2.4 (EI24) domain-containing protein [Hirsutella rhossiliensis]